MDAQLQCPVCTLYLHAGINLQDHLETHPKDKVISALVNLTIGKGPETFPTTNENYYYEDGYETQSIQAPGSPVTTNNLMVTRALPAASETRAFATYYTPIQQPTAARQVMIVDRTRVFHGATSTSQNDLPRRRMISKNIPTFDSNVTNTSGQTLQLITASATNHNSTIYTERPPPPYYMSVQDSLAKRNANLNQTQQNNNSNDNNNWSDQLNDSTHSTNIKIENSTHHTIAVDTNKNSTTEIQTSKTQSIDSSVSTCQSNLKNTNGSTAPNTHTDNNSIETQLKELGELILGGSSNDGDVEWLDISSDSIKNSDQKKIGLKILSNVKVSTNSILNVASTSSTVCSESQSKDKSEPCTSSAIENENNQSTNNNEITKPSEKRKIGLKVLSNVKVPANAVLNVSSFKPKNVDAVSSNNMIIIGTRPTPNSTVKNPTAQISVQPSTSKDALEKLKVSSSNEAIPMEIETSVTTTKLTDDKIISLDSESENEDDIKNDITIQSNCPSKATSVIRLASQKSSNKSETTQRSITLQKSINNRGPKKLVVKLKKPFVPVIEEEANLHPPENSNEPIPPNNLNNSSVKTEPKSNDDNNIKIENGLNAEMPIGKNDLDLTLECSEDVPFSPLRQSYTPLPRYHASASNEICTNESSVSEVILASSAISEYKDIKKHILNKLENGSKQSQDIVVFEISIKDGKIKTEADLLQDTTTQSLSSSAMSASTSTSNSSSSSSSASSSSSSSLSSSNSTSATPSTSQNNFSQSAVRADYALPTFLDYNNEQHNEDYLYSGVHLSPLPLVNESENWSHRFSPQYANFEMEKNNSYVDLDGCKTNSNGERAPSTDSLNIRTDEKMPAKGEISEQESNGDVEGSWSHQMYLDHDNLPRYTSSYDTTVARESWSLSNEHNMAHGIENMSTILSKITSIEQTDTKLDIKPTAESLMQGMELSKEKKMIKPRKYRCPMCMKIFCTLKEKRIHLITDHDYQEGFTSIRVTTAARFPKTKKPIETITSASCSTLSTSEPPLLECKIEKTECPVKTAKPFTSLNNYLLSYNWSTLKAQPTEGPKDELTKLFSIIESGTNYVCKMCEEQFNSIRAYDMHMSIHPAECYTCGRTFKRWVNFSIHLKRHLNIREHCCSYCPKRFVLRQNMIEHMRVHSNEAPIKCGICMKRFKRYSNLIQHRNRHHLKQRPKDKDYICWCGEVFHSQAKIAWHRETHDEKPKCCPYCRERFMHKNSLVRHIRLSHTERFHLFKRDSVECPYCKKRYIKSSLKVHMEQHKQSKTLYECTICNKSLTTKWNLKQHKWIHASRSSKPFKCSLCTKAFVRETEYTSHMNTHKSIKPYTCDYCGCQFARKYNWLRHTREHVTPKNFQCEICNKVFHRAYYLKEHTRSHTGERPFECGICGKTSTTKTNHNKHVKIHHARDPLTAEG